MMSLQNGVLANLELVANIATSDARIDPIGCVFIIADCNISTCQSFVIRAL